jgi:hypothetical protein
VLESGKVEFVRRTLHTYIHLFQFFVWMRSTAGVFLFAYLGWGVLIVLDDDYLVRRSVTSRCY